MFEIEAHYYNRKIYLSDGRIFQLGEILLRYFSASLPDIDKLTRYVEQQNPIYRLIRI